MFLLFLLALPLLAVGAILFAVFALLGPLLGFLIALPFRILGLVFSFVGWLLVLPLLILGGGLALAGIVFGLLLGGGFLLLPLAPLVLLTLAIVWLVRRGRRSPVHA